MMHKYLIKTCQLENVLAIDGCVVPEATTEGFLVNKSKSVWECEIQ